MAKHYQSLSIDCDIRPLLSDCEKVYREYHPELDLIPLSKSKLLYEIIVFYLKKTKYEVKK